jgi:acetolactate synthase-1/2/3 large subunit
MKKSGAWLTVRALEQLGVRYTFGIPGVHNTELYDDLNSSNSITPILVTHEGCGAFMADAMSRLSDSVGTLAIVPAAGAALASSGIGEAFMGGIPMLIIAAAVRTDIKFRYQLHQMDQRKLVEPITKANFAVATHNDLVPTLFEAYRIATSGEPGPVFVEIPVNVLLFTGDVDSIPEWVPAAAPPLPPKSDIARAADLLLAARRPGLFVGWGARNAAAEAAAVAEFVQAPVSTTLQGLSAFSAQHPLHTGFGFGPASVPASRNAFADCDCLLAIGTKFAEIATGSFGVTVPENLIHVDINPQVFSANYPAKVALEGDAKAVLAALLAELRSRSQPPAADAGLSLKIAADKKAYREEWYKHDSKGRVNPARFFDALRARLPDDGVVVVDDGNHTYLTAELFTVHRTGTLAVPTDFNCMGYAVPAAVGAKLARPKSEVVAVVGDGAFMMTCMEIVTAVLNRLGIVYYVFHDGELSQIAQAQKVTYNRTPCTATGALNLEGVALATGAAYVLMENDARAVQAVREAHEIAATGRPVIVDVAIDYSKPTAFTKGAVKTNFKRLSLPQKIRMAMRVIARRIGG